MNDEIKKYIDTKISVLSKLLNVCENCGNGIYKISNICISPAPLQCSECGHHKNILSNTKLVENTQTTTQFNNNNNNKKNINNCELEQLDESLSNLFD